MSNPAIYFKISEMEDLSAIKLSLFRTAQAFQENNIKKLDNFYLML